MAETTPKFEFHQVIKRRRPEDIGNGDHTSFYFIFRILEFLGADESDAVPNRVEVEHEISISRDDPFPSLDLYILLYDCLVGSGMPPCEVHRNLCQALPSFKETYLSEDQEHCMIEAIMYCVHKYVGFGMENEVETAPMMCFDQMVVQYRRPGDDGGSSFDFVFMILDDFETSNGDPIFFRVAAERSMLQCYDLFPSPDLRRLLDEFLVGHGFSPEDTNYILTNSLAWIKQRLREDHRRLITSARCRVNRYFRLEDDEFAAVWEAAAINTGVPEFMEEESGGSFVPATKKSVKALTRINLLEECGACKEHLSQGRNLIVMPYSSVFHEHCILQLLDRSNIKALGRIDLGEDCAICNEQLSEATTLIDMPCLHQFHEDCILKWLNINHNCPLCRFALPVSNWPSTYPILEGWVQNWW